MSNILKKVFLLFAFFFLSGLDFLFLIKFYSLQKKHIQQERILKEISSFNASSVKQFSFSAPPLVLAAASAEGKLVDGRVANLKNFFRKYNSPLYDYAEKIVTVSDKYGFDYRLLPAIAMQESTLCKYIPENSYNCWGFGIYGDQVLRFSSYDEAIETVAAAIKKDYLDKGLITPEMVMRKYTPSSPGSWARGVNFTFGLLE